MSREIKFRGKCKDDGTWVFGSYVRTALGLNYILPQNVLGNSSIQWLVNGKTVGQYTGLKDKHGKEIYEGDIVKTHDQNNVIEYEYGSFLVKGLHADEYERTHSVLYHYLVDATIPDMPHSRFDGVTTTLEVIGSIYENPELLAI